MNREKIVRKGNKVLVEYTGKLKNGKIFDKTEKGKPVEFVVGSGKIMPGFDKAVKGMKVNERKTVTINSEEVYGKRREDLIEELPMDSLITDGEVKKGKRMVVETPSRVISVTIRDVKKDKVVIDANHPLAGKYLVFDLKVVGLGSH
ncbi:hypothetical protein BEH94_08025 [Candidatus Altiarchaeales archaeon WOR_SM1_SCG]|nr:hypothetical protein BEH94_08025 [Candidatus Altiarchaeales archaeon WOR_SM1_SCG]